MTFIEVFPTLDLKTKNSFDNILKLLTRHILAVYMFISLTWDVIAARKAYIPLRRKIPGVGGWRWAIPPTPEF